MAARILAAGSFMAAVAQASYGYSNVTSAATDVYYTTEVVEHLTTYCPSATTLTYGDKTYTVTSETTLTITDCSCTITKPVEPTATPVHQDECAAKCSMEADKCRTAPDANQAQCSAEYADCLGYNPYGEGSFETPTACSAKPTTTSSTTIVCPEPTTVTYGTTTYVVTEATTLTVPCTTESTTETKPVNPPMVTPPAGSQPPYVPQPPKSLTTTTIQVSEPAGQPSGYVSQPTIPTGYATVPAVTPVPTAGAGRVVPGALVVLGALALL